MAGEPYDVVQPAPVRREFTTPGCPAVPLTTVMSTDVQPQQSRTYEVRTYGCQMNGRPAGVPPGHDFRAANVEIR